MESLPCRRCTHDIEGHPPRCPQCGVENPVIKYGPAMEAKAQAIVALFSLAVMAGIAFLFFLLAR